MWCITFLLLSLLSVHKVSSFRSTGHGFYKRAALFVSTLDEYKQAAFELLNTSTVDETVLRVALKLMEKDMNKEKVVELLQKDKDKELKLLQKDKDVELLQKDIKQDLELFQKDKDLLLSEKKVELLKKDSKMKLLINKQEMQMKLTKAYFLSLIHISEPTRPY